MLRKTPTALLFILLLLLISAEAWSAEARPDSRALLRDLEKVVALQEQAGWQVDEYEFREMMPAAMNSICRIPQEGFAEAKTISAQKVEGLGGDPARRLEESGHDMEAIEELLTAWRVQQLFVRSEAELKHCPFWMERSANFRGRHSDEDRWGFSAEGGGLFLARVSDGDYRFGGGGGGRFTAGYGFHRSWDFRSGLGFGGGALGDSTVRTENVAIDYYMDLPLILRHTNMLWRQEIEVAPIAVGIPWAQSLRYGARVGGLIGVSYLRVGEVMPWAGLVVCAEYVFARANLPEAWTVRVGARFGFSWTPE